MARAHVHSAHSFDRGGGGVEEAGGVSASASASASGSQHPIKSSDEAPDNDHAASVNAACEREWRAADRAARMLAGAFDFSRLLLLQNGYHIEVWGLRMIFLEYIRVCYIVGSQGCLCSCTHAC